ncbi:complement factor H-like isoform X2 [Platichthys flesus]|uniref:complement factor H-like isoform X2 n=1 Tax=Platichthys flesus TaxID=8260 RepID=UPI002DBF33A8|nr:complement factor H-like isoform X2 [Platichthys flesus]
MCSRYLGFILLVWFPGALHAQSAAQPCPAPSLDRGYFVPVQGTYSHDSKLTYACESPLKPAVEGWWAGSVCQNGTWSPTPRCIEETACIPPTIANAKYTEASDGRYKDGDIIRITCDKGYEHKANVATARCRNGTWVSLPTCEISIKSCKAPPKAPHAVIIDQGYKELFPEDAGVKYKCEDGYSIEGSHNYTLFCQAGIWTDGPMCSSGPDIGLGGSADAGTVGGHSTSSGRGTQPGHGGSSSTSANRPLLTTIEHCGTHPIVPNGVVVEEQRMYLKFKCQAFYKQVGEGTVTCFSDGSWSEVPVCEEAFCVLKPGYYDRSSKVSVAMYINEGEMKHIPCVWRDWSVAVRCFNRTITHTRCCHRDDHYWRYCT